MRETRARLRAVAEGELELPEPVRPSDQGPIRARRMSNEEFLRRTGGFDGTASETDRFARPIPNRMAPWFAILATTSALLSGFVVLRGAVADLSAPASDVDAWEIEVYTTATGRHYHRAGCEGYVRITLAEARVEGLARCHKCSPPR